ncbi:glycine--tRNA ligase subunit beta [Sphingobium yanoikuyae]|uniref:Glycine--tRNA ligase beta subunit n=1 Tax=Sphingobium yanoikuyae TaxID=13690 RepID=A0A6M4G6L2_SPHYA|nr:glycine--tRNA ligase subunit beta [Sphingobium yanoikuyae]QJR02570.1 glycine--tRNA ligase subunit beta [Sphingobium yanoikuyae]
MTDFLLELRCEEIPARMQLKASDDLARLFTEELAKAGLKPASIDSFVTPRRLALIARDLPLETAAVSEEFKGPRTSAPAQALEGFLRKTGLTQDQLEDRDGVWFAVVNKPGRATTNVLAEAVPAVIRAFPWPKSMRWGAASATTESLRWVRPLQGIIALLGGEIVPLSIEGVEAGRETVGHRFHSTGAIRIDGAHDYADKLRAAYVIVSHQERQAIIEAKAGEAAAAKGYSVIEDKGLVAENAGLTEWPVPLLGDFDPEFLEVPPEVIQLTLRINQKYFVLRDATGKLAPAFICTANIEAKDGGVAIVAGNRKVLAARLSDARFFWQQDRKTPLAEQAKKLGRITFHEKLGTVADKVERVAKLAEWLAREGIVPNCDPVLARQAAELCKADLVTEMVGEFPELQGVMGGYYARAEGLPDAVADAIRDHYKPVGQGDDVPTAPVTVAVSLADKLDTISQFFGIEEKPTGSKDPFALRRAAVGIIALIKENRLRMSVLLSSVWSLLQRDSASKAIIAKQDKRAEVLNAVLDELGPEAAIGSVKGWASSVKEGTFKNEVRNAVIEQMSADLPIAASVRDFILDRLEVAERDNGVSVDLIRAVRTWNEGSEDDLVRLLARVKALQSFVATDDGANLLAGYKRAANILKKEGVEQAEAISLSYEPEKAEADLIAALDAAEPQAAQAVAAEEFEGAMAALATLRAPIDAFFETVTVNDADPAKRTTRLALLARVRDAVHNVADFSKITG